MATPSCSSTRASNPPGTRRRRLPARFVCASRPYACRIRVTADGCTCRRAATVASGRPGWRRSSLSTRAVVSGRSLTGGGGPHGPAACRAWRGDRAGEHALLGVQEQELVRVGVQPQHAAFDQPARDPRGDVGEPVEIGTVPGPPQEQEPALRVGETGDVRWPLRAGDERDSLRPPLKPDGLELAGEPEITAEPERFVDDGRPAAGL